MSINLFTVTFRRYRTLIFAVVCASFFVFLNTYKFNNKITLDGIMNSMSMHNFTVHQFYESRNSWQLSNLGKILYTNEEYPINNIENKNKTFTILIWKHWNFLKKRHLYNYGKVIKDPLYQCSVQNCEFTGDDDKLETADAVVIHLHRGDIPPSENRSYTQRWIFLNDESPFNAFALSKKKVALSTLVDVFNWSMTYRSDSDVPVPYGRTVSLSAPMYTDSYPPTENLVPNWQIKRRDVLVAILISNCHVSYRNEIIKGLKKYMHVDVHGKCGDDKLKKSCPGHFRADCDEMSHYLFYLVLENSKCSQYMTEKLFHNAYSRGAIPVIQGPSLEDCQKLLPPNSYLHVDNYASLEDLSKDLLRISETETGLLYYHRWRNNFEVLNEHGFFGTKSYHLCRVCEAMNYNDKAVSVYSESRIFQFLLPSMLCRK